ncbi:MAG: polysaccharide biosynthesis protein [Pirellulales bacterium]|nr:polysaccharide biosynthesis protein [Pirellulales bacterium]
MLKATSGKQASGRLQRLAGAIADLARRSALRWRPLVSAAMLLPVFVATYYFAYWLRFEGQLGPRDVRVFSSTIVWIVCLKLLLFAWFRAYQGWGRFLTFYDLLALVKAATGSLLLTIIIDRFTDPTCTIARSIYLLDWGATIVAVGGARALVRLAIERRRILFLSAEQIPAFIVGASDGGESLLRAIIRNGQLTYHVLGFLDSDPRRLGTHIGGVPVLGTPDQTFELAERHGIRELLIVSDGLAGRQIRDLLEQAPRHGVQVRVLPSYEQLIRGSVAIQPQPVSINDLLRREPVQLEMDNLRQWIDGRNLLVTGSAGSIGSEICRQLLKFSPEKLVLVDRSENGQFFLERELRQLAPGAPLEVCIADILDQRHMAGLLECHQPHILFHAAAYKHVPLMEAHPGEAVKNIVVATKGLADLAMDYGVDSFVMISTDKAVNPTSVMGACKRVAEMYVQSLADLSPCRFVTVRFGNVLDSAGSVVQVFRQQILAGGPVTVTDDRMERYFMTIPEAARLVIQAGVIGNGGEILVLDMGSPVRIVDLAADMVRLSGLKVGEDIEIEIVGLRPGEKLYEELHAHGEKHLPTRHPKIMVADRRHRNADAVHAAIRELERLVEDDPGRVRLCLQRIVPEYQAAAHERAQRLAAA